MLRRHYIKAGIAIGKAVAEAVGARGERADKIVKTTAQLVTVGTSLFVSTATGDAVGAAFSAFDAADAADAASSMYDTANNAVLTSSDALATGDLSGAADALNSTNGPTPDLSRVARAAHIASSPVDTYTAVSEANAARWAADGRSR